MKTRMLVIDEFEGEELPIAFLTVIKWDDIRVVELVDRLRLSDGMEIRPHGALQHLD